MWTFEILLIFHFFLLLAQKIGGHDHEQDTVTIQVSKEIVPNRPAPHSVLSMATMSSRLMPPATTSSLDPHGNAESYVIGGTAVVGRLYPWIVSIRAAKKTHVCAGSLISTRSVLTTATCIREASRPDLITTVLLGTNSVNRSGDVGVLKSVHYIKYYERFSFHNRQHDLAILTLESPVTLSTNIRPVSLGTNRTMAGTKVKVAGWGGTTISAMTSNSLQHVELDVISNDDCIMRYADFPSRKIMPEMLCAGSPGKNPCSGDHGDPLMQNGVLVGLFSIGVDCGVHPGIFTRVASYIPWINANKFD